MRTTVDLDEALFRKAKAHAALRGIRFKKLVEDGLKLALEKPAAQGERVVFPLIPSQSKKKLKIPADIAYRVQQKDDRERYEASLRR
jgi:hypothetical protein